MFKSFFCASKCAWDGEENVGGDVEATGDIDLQPTGHSLTFNSCTFCPHFIYMFCIYLRTNSDICHLQHKLIAFYNRDEKFTARHELRR